MKWFNRKCVYLLVAFASSQEGRSQPAGIFTEVQSVGNRLGPQLNTPAWDGVPRITCDGLSLYVRRETAGQFDNYVATRSTNNELFGEPTRLEEPVNTAWHEGAVSVTADHLELYFTSDRPEGGHGGRDVHVAKRADVDAPFVVENLGPNINGPDNDNNPDISSDGLTLFFHSWRPDGPGQVNIYVATRESRHDPFDNLVLLDAPVNTTSQAAANPSYDTLAFFFNSSRTGGHGQSDLYLATRPSLVEPFDTVINLSAISDGINTPWNDRYADISCDWPADGSILYFASDRPGGEGHFDIYQATWVADPPEAIFTVTPESGQSPLEIQVDATASTIRESYEILSYDWDFGDGMTAGGSAASHTYGAPGVYTVRLTITTDDRELTAEAERYVMVSLPSEDVAPWSSEDIGAPTFPGGVRFDADCLLVMAGGRGISSRRDQFHFVHQELSGDTTITARITQLAADGSPKVGVMLRESSDDNAPQVAMLLRPSSDAYQLEFLHRATTNAIAKTTRTGTLPDTWVRLERQGDIFIGSHSADGKTWSEGARVTLALPETLHGGVAATARDATGSLRTVLATVCDLTVGPPAAPGPSFLRGDCDQDGNACSGVNDALELLSWLFLGRTEPPCLAACDPDGNGTLELADAVYGLNFCFAGRAAPVEPYPACGTGSLPGDRDLGCNGAACQP